MTDKELNRLKEEFGKPYPEIIGYTGSMVQASVMQIEASRQLFNKAARKQK